MRRTWTAFALLLLLAPAQAAPTCQDRDGDTIRCGAPGAMPVGWKPAVPRSKVPPGPDAETVFELFGALALLFAMIALLPDFDGSRPGDWDRQEDDDRPIS